MKMDIVKNQNALEKINEWLKSVLYNENLANCLIVALKNGFAKEVQQMPMNVEIVLRDYSQAHTIWLSYVRTIMLAYKEQDIEQTDFVLWVLHLYTKNENNEDFIEFRKKIINQEYQSQEIVWCLMIAKYFNSYGEFIRYYIAKQGKEITWI